MPGSSRTLVLASSYAFNAPTPNDCSPHSLLAALPLLSGAVTLKNKEDKRTILLPARLSFQDMAEKNLGCKEKEKDHHFSLVLSQSPRRATCWASCLRTRGCFPDVLIASPLSSKVTVGEGRQSTTFLPIFDRKVSGPIQL